MATIREKGFVMVEQPLYSLDFASSDNVMFGNLKTRTLRRDKHIQSFLVLSGGYLVHFRYYTGSEASDRLKMLVFEFRRSK